MEKLDLNQILEVNFLGDWEFFATVADAFQQSVSDSMAKLHQAIVAQDKKKVRDYAHKMVGSVAHFHHVAPVTTARALENGHEKLSLEEMHQHYSQLQAQIDLLIVDLRVLCERRSVA